MKTYIEYVPVKLRERFNMAFCFDKLTLPFNSDCLGMYTGYFLDIAEASKNGTSTLAEIPMPEEELELARAALSHVYRRSSENQSPSKLLTPTAAIRVAVFAHKYAAKGLLTDADQCLSEWLPDSLQDQLEGRYMRSRPTAFLFPAQSIQSNLGSRSDWNVATWLSWLDFFDEPDLPLLRASCFRWLVDHPAEVQSFAAQLGTLLPATTSALFRKLAEALTRR